MTIRVKYTAKISHPIERVFAAAIDLAGLPRWSNVREVRRVSSNPIKNGTTFQLISHLGGENRTVDCRITVLEPPRRFVYVSDGLAKSEIGFELQATGEHTTVAYAVIVSVNALVEPLIRGELEKQAQTDLTRFVKLIEAG
jgi:uncharacterized protein YndB with AHSA1/START domain